MNQICLYSQDTESVGVKLYGIGISELNSSVLPLNKVLKPLYGGVVNKIEINR